MKKRRLDPFQGIEKRLKVKVLFNLNKPFELTSAKFTDAVYSPRRNHASFAGAQVRDSLNLTCNHMLV